MEISDTLTLEIIILLISLKPFKETNTAIAKVVNLEDHMLSENVPHIDIDKNIQYQFVFKNRNITFQDYDRCALILNMRGIDYKKDKIVIRVKLEPTDTCAYSLSLFIGKSSAENIPIVTLSCYNITDWEGHFPMSYVFVQFRRIKNKHISDDVLDEINATISFTTCTTCYEIPEYFDKNIVQLINHCDQSKFCMDNKPEVYYGGGYLKTCSNCQLTFDVQEPVEICFRVHSVFSFYSELYCKFRMLLGENQTLTLNYPVYQDWCLPREIIEQKIIFSFGGWLDCRLFWNFCKISIKINTTEQTSDICSKRKEEKKKLLKSKSTTERPWLERDLSSSVDWSSETEESSNVWNFYTDYDKYLIIGGVVGICLIFGIVVLYRFYVSKRNSDHLRGTDILNENNDNYRMQTTTYTLPVNDSDITISSSRRNSGNRDSLQSSSQRVPSTEQQNYSLPPPYTQLNRTPVNNIQNDNLTDDSLYNHDHCATNEINSNETIGEPPPPSYDDACRYYMK